MRRVDHSSQSKVSVPDNNNNDKNKFKIRKDFSSKYEIFSFHGKECANLEIFFFSIKVSNEDNKNNNDIDKDKERGSRVHLSLVAQSLHRNIRKSPRP